MDSTVSSLLTYATTALAAYADGSKATVGDLYSRLLRNEGIAATYADTFLSEFRVVDYFNDSIGADAAGLQGLSPGIRIPSFVSATAYPRIGTHDRSPSTLTR